jgi:hypothetical protein
VSGTIKQHWLLLKLGAMTLKIPLQGGGAVIAISPDDQLLLPCYHFAQSGVPINGQLYDLYRQSEEVEKYRNLRESCRCAKVAQSGVI